MPKLTVYLCCLIQPGDPGTVLVRVLAADAEADDALLPPMSRIGAACVPPEAAAVGVAAAMWPAAAAALVTRRRGWMVAIGAPPPAACIGNVAAAPRIRGPIAFPAIAAVALLPGRAAPGRTSIDVVECKGCARQLAARNSAETAPVVRNDQACAHSRAGPLICRPSTRRCRSTAGDP